jgi:hypothetical protein
MTTNQEGRHVVVRASTGTTRDHLSDWHALFTAAGIAAADWNSRFIQWANVQLSSAYTNINEAKRAYAVSQGFTRWQDINTFTIGGGGSGPAVGDGFLLEDGTSFLLLESGDFLLLE